MHCGVKVMGTPAGPLKDQNMVDNAVNPKAKQLRNRTRSKGSKKKGCRSRDLQQRTAGGGGYAQAAPLALTPGRHTQKIDEPKGRVGLQSPGQLRSSPRLDAILCRHMNKGGDES
jgi:hypothetical protein